MSTAQHATTQTRLDRARKYERILFRLRKDYPYYYEIGRGGKASVLIAKCKLLATPLWEARAKRRQSSYQANRGY